MPRIAKVGHVVEYAKPDGSILRARIELRPEGTYALDLRKYKRGRPTLKPPGSSSGTTDLKEARRLAINELAALAGGQPVGTPAVIAGPQTQLREYLDRKLRNGEMTQHTADQAWTCVRRCWKILHEKFGVMQWTEVQRRHIGELEKLLYESRGPDADRLSRNTVVKHFNYLKGFYRHIVDAGLMEGSPVHRHSAIPKRDLSFESDWLEPWELGLLLEVSFAARDSYGPRACMAWPEILSCEAYMGPREREILGLEVRDLSLTGGVHGAGTIHIRPNQWRRLKDNEKCQRIFSLWPAHGRIMAAYMKRVNPPRGGLLFPNPEGQMWRDLRESMARDLKAAGVTKHITDHALRHSYITARSRMYTQVVRGGEIEVVPVHLQTIMNEVGHVAASTTTKIYTHASMNPVPGWTELDYAVALAEYRQAQAPAKTRKRKVKKKKAA